MKRLMVETDCDECAVEKGAVFERVDYTIEHKEFEDGWLLKVQDVDLSKTHVWQISSECPQDIIRWMQEWFSEKDDIAEQLILQGKAGAFEISVVEKWLHENAGRD